MYNNISINHDIIVYNRLTLYERISLNINFFVLDLYMSIKKCFSK